MRIKVQWQDIFAGTRHFGNACAVAKAIQRQVPGLTCVNVGRGEITLMSHVTDEKGWRLGHLASQPTPAEVRGKIRTFDKWGFVWPFAFELKTVISKAVTCDRPMKNLDEMLQEVEEGVLV